MPHRPPTGTIQDGNLDDWYRAERGLLLDPFTLSPLTGTLHTGRVVHLREDRVEPFEF